MKSKAISIRTTRLPLASIIIAILEHKIATMWLDPMTKSPETLSLQKLNCSYKKRRLLRRSWKESIKKRKKC
jgi:hypothetical protein